MTENTKRGARGSHPAAATQIGNPAENTLLPDTVAELKQLGITPTEIALDGGFNPGPTNAALEDLTPDRMFIAGRQQPGSDAPSGGCSATEPAPRAGSATSNAATAWTDPGSKATKAARSGPDGRS